MQNRITIALACAVALVAIPATSHARGISYLECMMDSGDNTPVLWKIALDEEAKTISFEHPFANSTRPATFTADRVVWNGGAFAISRTTLTFTRNALGQTDEGKCKVVQPPKRAF